MTCSPEAFQESKVEWATEVSGLFLEVGEEKKEKKEMQLDEAFSEN